MYLQFHYFIQFFQISVTYIVSKPISKTDKAPRYIINLRLTKERTFETARYIYVHRVQQAFPYIYVNNITVVYIGGQNMELLIVPCRPDLVLLLIWWGCFFWLRLFLIYVSHYGNAIIIVGENIVDTHDSMETLYRVVGTSYLFLYHQNPYSQVYIKDKWDMWKQFVLWIRIWIIMNRNIERIWLQSQDIKEILVFALEFIIIRSRIYIKY